MKTRWDAAVAERGLKCRKQGVGVLSGEELAVTADATVVVDEGDRLGLDLLSFETHVRTAHGIGVPELVGVRSTFRGVVGSEHHETLQHLPGRDARLWPTARKS